MIYLWIYLIGVVIWGGGLLIADACSDHFEDIDPIPMIAIIGAPFWPLLIAFGILVVVPRLLWDKIFGPEKL